MKRNLVISRTTTVHTAAFMGGVRQSLRLGVLCARVEVLEKGRGR